jgi:flagellar hook assembly protein FlgD
VVDKLNANYPNPFNPSTTISFSVKNVNNPANLVIYNTRGQIVRRLFQGLPSGNHVSLVWDGKDDSGKAVSSGIYLLKLRSGKFVQTRKMLLSK